MVVPESMGHEKVCGKGCSPPHNTERCVTSAVFSQEELDLNLNSVYNVGDYYMTVEIHATCTYNLYV